jgi:hypothetical protein
MLYSPFALLFSLFLPLCKWINDNNGENGGENSENSRQNGESDWGRRGGGSVWIGG